MRLSPRELIVCSLLLGILFGWLIILDTDLAHEQGLAATIARVAIVVACCKAALWWNLGGWENVVRFVDRVLLGE